MEPRKEIEKARFAIVPHLISSFKLHTENNNDKKEKEKRIHNPNLPKKTGKDGFIQLFLKESPNQTFLSFQTCQGALLNILHRV